MGNQITDKRGLIVILIVGTVIVFIGLLWAIATFLPFNLPDSASPTETMDAPREKENCASPVGYWTRHPELYPGRVVIGEHVYEAAELDTVFSDQSDLQALLQAQLASAYLN
ncbi:MAG: hypothetical protein FIA98_11170, partial [Anaerolineae bacterium]|nr:hypothetical protein [Anaerolineae bacterium]